MVAYMEKTGSTLAMGAVLTFSMAPMLLFVLIGGVAVDRLRVRLLLISDLGRGVRPTTAVTWLALSGRLEIWHIYGASLLFRPRRRLLSTGVSGPGAGVDASSR